MNLSRKYVISWPVKLFIYREIVNIKMAWKSQARMISSSRIGSAVMAQSQFLEAKVPQLMANFSDRGNQNSPWIPESTVQEVCDHYHGLANEGRLTFLSAMASGMGTRHDRVRKEANLLQTQAGREDASILQAENRLRQSLIPGYSTLFSHISRLRGGVKFLVDLRADLLNHLSSQKSLPNEAELKALNDTLKDLLIGWFAAGMLNLERVTWSSSCDMLEKISQYEAVHPVRHWTDIKHRVGPYRRCFVFTHSSMPNEPLVILHTALTRDISASIQSIVRKQDDIAIGVKPGEEDPDEAQAAIFYSITSTQKGLQGVELGNHLIKSVVKELQSEFPSMHLFSSLSPIPGFRDWLVSQINKEVKDGHKNSLLTAQELDSFQSAIDIASPQALPTLKKVIVTNEWVKSERLVESLQSPLMRLCARYLYSEKRRKMALNTVANFHLRNGATMWRLNWLGDTSPRGLTASCGMMVNYRYYLENTTSLSQHYIETQNIEASQQILDLVGEGLSSGETGNVNSKL
ncbi:malonyl-CoA decarboxylase, mitochondrial-like [Lytechinus variegatus]|uniref:malonyl-CoA decarboxylase, mitochondrial-like n=1 Tax=Lytechinus variegatus TaxID=7654 RepID=UPI001BB28F95|nr:malonyl-CoA decarboxylase, mitochondrial-like [Lytechinus variegatus]